MDRERYWSIVIKSIGIRLCKAVVSVGYASSFGCFINTGFRQKRFYDKYFHGVGWEPRDAIFDEQWIIIIDDSAHFHHLLILRITSRQNATHSDVSSTAQPLLFLPRNIWGPRCIPTRRLWKTIMLISVINSILRPGQKKSHFTDDILDLTVAYRNCFFFI